MEEATARETLAQQNELARQRLLLLRKRLLGIARQRRAELTAHKGRATRFFSILEAKPEPRQLMLSTYQWLKDTKDIASATFGSENRAMYINYWNAYEVEFWEAFASSASAPNNSGHADPVDHYLRDLTYRLGKLIAACKEAPGTIVKVPDGIHRLRHGRLADGKLAQVLVDELAEAINEGERMGSSEVFTVEQLRQWKYSTENLLWSRFVGDVSYGLKNAFGGEDYYDSDLVHDAMLVERAYITLGLIYLKEVHTHMSDYAAASGQSAPQPRISITANTILGGQFADQIVNLDSTIAGLVQHGDNDVAAALKALEEAVLSQKDLDEEQRRDFLESVGFLAQAAQTPPEKRSRGVIRSVLAGLRTASAAGSEVQTALDTWGGVLDQLQSY